MITWTRWVTWYCWVTWYWTTMLAMRLCGATIVIEAWCWAVSLASVVVAWWRALATYYAMWACGVCNTVARGHIDSYIHLAWTTHICTINTICHCTANCHY